MDDSKNKPQNLNITRHAFQEKIEPGLRKLLETALVESGIKPEQKDEYQAVSRRIFRAAIASTSGFLKAKTEASARFLVQQGAEALTKAAERLYPSEQAIAEKQDALLGEDKD